jgi:hypothetical protein
VAAAIYRFFHDVRPVRDVPPPRFFIHPDTRWKPPAEAAVAAILRALRWFCERE